MKERPILYKGEMVIANLEGRKTQTRRVAEQPPLGWAFDGNYGRINSPHPHKGKFGAFIRHGVGTDTPQINIIPSPYGEPGNRLWVKETWKIASVWDDHSPSKLPILAMGRDDVRYLADGDTDLSGKTRVSIFMPRWASRLMLEIEAIRVERLQDISEEDAKAEGIRNEWSNDQGETPGRYLFYTDADRPGIGHPTAIEAYRILWNSINLKPSPLYAKNPATGKKEIIGYQSYPWSAEDFDAKYPGTREAGIYRRKPITITSNPWVWVISYKKL